MSNTRRDTAIQHAMLGRTKPRFEVTQLILSESVVAANASTCEGRPGVWAEAEVRQPRANRFVIQGRASPGHGATAVYNRMALVPPSDS